jgi:hypothetical protein
MRFFFGSGFCTPSGNNCTHRAARVFLKVLKVLQALPWNDSGVRWTSACFSFPVCGQPAKVSKARCPTELRAGRTDFKA